MRRAAHVLEVEAARLAFEVVARLDEHADAGAIEKRQIRAVEDDITRGRCDEGGERERSPGAVAMSISPDKERSWLASWRVSSEEGEAQSPSSGVQTRPSETSLQ